jgi:hypothetical protein
MNKKNIIKDIILILAAIIMVVIMFKNFIHVQQMKIALNVFVGVVILCLFLYKQLKPYKNLLYPKYQKWYSYIEVVFDWVFKIIHLKPAKLGDNLAIDMSSLIVLILFILLLIF